MHNTYINIPPMEYAKNQNKNRLISSTSKYAILLNSDAAVCAAICAAIVGTTIANLGTGFEVVFGVSQELISNAAKAVILLFLIAAAPTIFYRAARSVVLFTIGIFFVSLTQILCFPELNTCYSSNLRVFVVLVFPLCVCVVALQDYRKLIDYLFKASFVMAVMIGAIMVIYGGSFFNHYNMGFSGSLVIPTDALILYAVKYTTSKRIRIVSLILAFVLFASILLYGSRGACAAIVAFCAVLLLKTENKSKSTFLLKLVIVAAVALVVICFYQIIDWLYWWSVDAGFNSRTLSLMHQGSGITQDSGRSEIWELIISRLIDDPFAIRGINAEWVMIGGYAHNFILELCYHFGILIGGLLSIGILVLAGKTLVAKPDVEASAAAKAKTDVELLFLLTFIPISFWSGSIWTSTSFWPWLILTIRK